MFIGPIVKITKSLSLDLYRRLHMTKISPLIHTVKTLSNRFHNPFNHFKNINNFNKFNNQDVSISKEWIFKCIIIKDSHII